MLVMKRVFASKNRQSGASLDEGKKEMSFEVYQRLCEELYNGKGVEMFLRMHAFLTIEWNFPSNETLNDGKITSINFSQSK